MNRPPLLIFDCDGVLIDSELISCQVVAEELTAWGAPHEGLEVAHRFAGFTDAAIAETVSAETGVALPTDFPERVQARALAAFETLLQPMPGMPQLLEEDRGARCVASNSGQVRLEKAIALVGLSRFFPEGGYFSAQQVARAKPAPDLHLHAAARMGFAPGEALVIEDSVTGVQASVSAGIPVVGLLAASHVKEGQEEALRAAGALEVFLSTDTLSDWLHG
ncbi:HAD family hydrolase [Limibacillus halophilus]